MRDDRWWARCALPTLRKTLPSLERRLAPFLYRELRLLGVLALLDFVEAALRAAGLFGRARRHRATCRGDGKPSEGGADPDAAARGQRQNLIRPMAAVRRPAIRSVDRRRHCLVARLRRQLLGT